MIILKLNKGMQFKVGDVVHLRICGMYEIAPGKWRLEAEDVTPLPGAEPPGYACVMCGLIENAKPDGSLPDGWAEKKYAEGSHFVCADEYCQKFPICRVCGCTDTDPCAGVRCHWVEPDLCSECVGKEK
jgi:hypothetical protein